MRNGFQSGAASVRLKQTLALSKTNKLIDKPLLHQHLTIAESVYAFDEGDSKNITRRKRWRANV